MRISKSPYERQRRAMARPDEHARLRERVREVFEGANRPRGYRRIARELRARDEPVVVSEKAVRRIMREEDLAAPYARKRARYGSCKGGISEAPANLVARDFRADAPDRLRLADIAGFGPAEGEACLSAIAGCFDGGLSGWSIGPRPDAELADGGPRAAAGALGADERPTVRSDRGCHYRWPGWISLCEEHGSVRSMSKKGCSPDSSAMEGCFGRLKNELFHHRGWAGVEIPGFCLMLDAYLGYYNEGRPKEGLGWLSPMECRKKLGLAA